MLSSLFFLPKYKPTTKCYHNRRKRRRRRTPSLFVHTVCLPAQLNKHPDNFSHRQLDSCLWFSQCSDATTLTLSHSDIQDLYHTPSTSQKVCGSRVNICFSPPFLQLLYIFANHRFSSTFLKNVRLNNDFYFLVPSSQTTFFYILIIWQESKEKKTHITTKSRFILPVDFCTHLNYLCSSSSNHHHKNESLADDEKYGCWHFAKASRRFCMFAVCLSVCLLQQLTLRSYCCSILYTINNRFVLRHPSVGFCQCL